MKGKLKDPWKTEVYVLKFMWAITFFQFHPWQFNFGLNDSNHGKKDTLCDRLFLNRLFFFLIRYFIYSHPKSSPIYLLLIDFNLNLENDLSST